MNIEELKIDDDFKTLLPSLSDEVFGDLEKDILANGLLSPIVTWKGYIVDGHNRYEICKRHGIKEVEVKNLPLPTTKSDVMQWIIGHQLGKRNLTKSQLVRSYESVERQIAKEAKERMIAVQNNNSARAVSSNLNEQREPIRTASKIAKKIGVSENTYRDMKLVANEGTPEQIERMDKGGKGNGVSAIAKEIRDENSPKKKCSKCGRMLPISAFKKQKDRKSGLSSWCKDCSNDKAAETRFLRSAQDQKIVDAVNFIKDPNSDTSITFDAFYGELEIITDSFVRRLTGALESNTNLIDTDEKREKILRLVNEISKMVITKGELNKWKSITDSK